MADNPTPSAVKTTPESFAVTAEEFASLKADAAKAKQLEEQFTALKTRNEELAAQFKETQRARRRDQLVARCEQFSAIPEKAEILADKFLALEERDPELAKYFDGLLHTLDTQVAQSMLFTQIASPRSATGGETFESFTDRIVKEKFGGDMKHYGEALRMATKERPDLFAIYNETYAPSKK